MESYATILSGDETLAAEIFYSPVSLRYIVRLVDNEARKDAGIDAIVGTVNVGTFDLAVRHANAFVTGTPVVLP